MSGSCVIFDLDGTLVDSEGLCNQAYLDLVPELDDSLETVTRRYRGTKLAVILADIEQRIARKLPRDFEEVYRARVAELYDSDLKPIPGARALLESLTLPFCLASNGPLTKIHHALEVCGLSSFFGEKIFSSYEVGSWKPDPGLFLHAAGAMGHRPEQCLVIEDSRLGIDAALAAGMKAFFFAPHGSEEPCDHPAVTRFQELSDLPDLLASTP